MKISIASLVVVASIWTGVSQASTDVMWWNDYLISATQAADFAVEAIEASQDCQGLADILNGVPSIDSPVVKDSLSELRVSIRALEMLDLSLRMQSGEVANADAVLADIAALKASVHGELVSRVQMCGSGSGVEKEFTIPTY